MISLYFNCRITNKGLIANSVAAGFFYPIVYPKTAQAIEYTQAQVLIKVIKSYSSIEFDTAIFNVSLDPEDHLMADDVKSAIDSNINAKQIIVRFTRPSTLEAWRGDLAEASKLIKANNPVMVVMNHDHLFVDYTPRIFNQTVDAIFPVTSENFGKALVYSHTPESIAELADDRFILSSDDIPFRQKDAKFLSSILVMTIETLESYVARINQSKDYIGRLIDWPGVTYDSFTLKVFNFPREFFKHFDGYGHITGLRNIGDLRNASGNIEFPNPSLGVAVLVDFYYHLWINCFAIYIRDRLNVGRGFWKSEKEIYVSAIENSLDLFKKGYINPDSQNAILPGALVKQVEDALRSHVYYHANELHEMLANEITLMHTSKSTKVYKILTNKIKHLIPFKFINQYKLLYKLERGRNKK